MPNPNTKGISVHVDRGLHAEITAYLQENNMKMGDFITLAAQELLRPPSMEIDPELQAEIDTYLEERNVTMAEFFAQAAQSQLHPHIPGIGSKLQEEIDTYLEEHGMAMDEFIALAAQDELRPKTPKMEVNEVENMRTLAFQVPESLFQRVKQYLERNHMTQKAFVLGLIEDKLNRDGELLRKQQEDAQAGEEEEQDEGLSEGREAPVSEDFPEDEYGDEPEESSSVSDSESEQEIEGEEQDEGLSEGSDAPVSEDFPEDEYGDELEDSPAVSDSEGSFEPEDEEETGADYEEVEDGAFPEETSQDKPSPGYIEGELGAAVEVAPNFYYGQDEQPAFPDLEDEEDQEFGGMSM